MPPLCAPFSHWSGEQWALPTERPRRSAFYLSTGSGWSPATDAALRALAARPGVELVAATDNNKQGEIYADRLLGLREQARCCGDRLRPVADDWNADLRMKVEAREMEGGGCRMPAGRLKGETSPARAGP
ncbi:toprim domain-containing protein [Mesorhizobium sp. B4-1-3]|uniref:toprim domain-containing protein n=1 Tax=Mesorhizobium sp. B4-1-3 TaxID=2589889 RepID=UPI001FEEB867|nr:toprim domain-containing protein [Mesorhizobium sp. B4-1-3]